MPHLHTVVVCAFSFCSFYSFCYLYSCVMEVVPGKCGGLIMRFSFNNG